MKKIITVLCMIAILTLMSTPAYAAKKDTTSPVISKTDPAGETTDVMIEKTIVIRFSEKIAKGKAFAKITVSEPGGTNVEYTAEIVDHLLKLTPVKKMAYNTVYTVVIPVAAVKDKAGNTLKTRFSFVFKTEKDPSAKEDQTREDGLFKYVINMEASLDHELTDAELAEYAELLKAIGFEAKFTGYKRMEK